MIVKELIERLKEYPDYYEIRTSDRHWHERNIDFVSLSANRTIGTYILLNYEQKLLPIDPEDE